MNLQTRQLHKRDFRELRANARRQRWPIARDPVKARDIAPLAPTEIIARMNEAPISPAAKRVSRFIKLFDRASELNASFRLFFETRDDMMDFLYHGPGPPAYKRKDDFSSGWEFKLPEMQELNKELNKVLTELNDLARRYKWHPLIRHMGYEMPNFNVTETWDTRGLEQGWETFAIWWMCQRDGEWIDRFRQCKECRSWFFAVAEHQSFCCDACRKRHASQSAEFKAKRRIYMHEYRRAEKQKDRRAKKALRRSR